MGHRRAAQPWHDHRLRVACRRLRGARNPHFKSFNLLNTDRRMVTAAYFWAYASLQIPAGWVVDENGVKFPFTFSFMFGCGFRRQSVCTLR